MKFIKTIWTKLDLRLTLIVLLMSLLPLLILGQFALTNSRRVLEEQKFDHLNGLNLLKADEIVQWENNHIRQIRALAQRPLVTEYATILVDPTIDASMTAFAQAKLNEDHLLPALANDSGFWELFLIDASNGRIVAATDELDVGKDRSNELYFQEGQREAFIQNIYFTPSLGEPTITVGTPVKDSNGTVIAVLAGHLELEGLSIIARQANDLTISEDTYLVNQSNFFITDPRFGNGFAMRESNFTAGAEACLQGKNGQDKYLDYRGTAVLGSYLWLPQQNLCVITEIDEAEALQPIISLQRSLILVGAAVGISIIIASIFFTRTITLPLQQLIEGAKRISRGDLDHQIPIKSHDEIGQLIETFNEMTGDLRRSLDATSHGQQLLLMLSQTAQRMQQARSPEAVYQTIGNEVEKLGFNVTILLLNETKAAARIGYMSFAPSVIQLAEKLTGLKAKNYHLSIKPGGHYDQVLKEKKTLFISPMDDLIAEALPKAANFLAPNLTKVMGMDQGIVAPLEVNDEIMGFLTVTGDVLTEADITAVSAFANQTAIALQNTRYLSQLKEKETRFRAIFEHAGVGIALVNMEGKPMETNPALQDMLGYSSEELTQMDFTQFTHPEDIAKDLTSFQSLVAGDLDLYEMEKRYIHKDGTILWGWLIVTLVRDANGTPQFAIGLVENITNRKQAEVALRRSEALRRVALEGAEMGTWFNDLDTGELFWDGRAREIFGADPDEPITLERGLSIIHPDDRDMVNEEFARATNPQTALGDYGLEYRILLQDETIRWVATKGRVIFEDDETLGRKAVRLTGIVMDITARKEAEKALRRHRDELEELVAQRAAALKASETRYRTLTESSPDMIFLIDHDHTVSYVNQSAASQFDKDRNDIIGQPHTSLFPAEIAAQQRDALQYVLQSGQTVQAENKVSFPHEDIWLHTRLVPITENGKEVTAVLGVSRDITSLKLAELALKQKAADLERSNQELEQFAYVASHDLQEPLRMVTSYLQLLQRRYQDHLDDDADEFICFAVDGADRMKILINDLLQYSRVGTRGKPFEAVDTELILKQTLTNLQNSIQDSGANITHDPLPTVWGDANQLSQLFQNLIGNGIKFRKDAPPELHVGVEKEENNWVFSVKDNGIGFETQFADRIFTIFQRLHTRANYSGTGIGLAICKKIVERHGGKIWVDSQPDAGTTFYFSLPNKKR